MAKSIQTLAGCSRIVVSHGSASQKSIENLRKNDEKTSAETCLEKHQNNTEIYLKMESENMKIPEKSGKMTSKNRSGKIIGQKKVLALSPVPEVVPKAT